MWVFVVDIVGLQCRAEIDCLWCMVEIVGFLCRVEIVSLFDIVGLWCTVQG